MNCDWVRNSIPLYVYGELPPEDEERLEQHLHGCSACAGEMELQRRITAALDRHQAQPSALLLADCRAELFSNLDPVPARRYAPVHEALPAKSAWSLFLEASAAAFSGFTRWRQPVGAVALVAVGFLAARFTGANPAGVQPQIPSGDVFATIRSIQPDASGHVRIAFDETRRREVSGRMDEQNIQRLLLAAAHENDASVRLESMGLLKEQTGSSEVRDALINALAHDPNAGIRLRALEGLKSLADDPQVRRSFAGALMSDDNPAVRSQAVDLLVSRRDDATVRVLQGLVQSDKNDYVRLKCEKALKDWNASIGTF